MAVLLPVSAAGWSLLLLLGPDNSMASGGICGAASSQFFTAFRQAAGTMLLFHPPLQMVLAWLVMLTAMMPPLLARPLEQLWHGGRTVYRPGATGLFVAAYAAVWTVAGILLMAAAMAFDVPGNTAGCPGWILVAIVAVTWQASPAKQRALNACRHPARIAPDGRDDWRASLRYGASTAVGCVGACWALMLMPMVVHRLEYPTMAIVSVVLLLERHLPARPVRWTLPLGAQMLRGLRTAMRWWRGARSTGSPTCVGMPAGLRQ